MGPDVMVHAPGIGGQHRFVLCVDGLRVHFSDASNAQTARVKVEFYGGGSDDGR